jgi:hypothetical protein
MLARFRLLALLLLAFAALTFAACGGTSAKDDPGDEAAASDDAAGDEGGDAADGDDDSDSADDGSEDGGSNGGQAGNDDLVAANGTAVLGASAEAFSEEITSMEGHLEMVMSGGGMNMTIDAGFAFLAPDKAYMSMAMAGDDGSGMDLGDLGTMEVLIRDDTFYMNIAFFGGWVYFPIDELGLTEADLADIEEMLSLDSTFDYQALVDAFGDVEFVGEEQVDGRDLLHYSVSVDFADLVGALGALESTGEDGYDVPVDTVSGPIELDVWVGADDYLPYVMTINADMTAAGESVSLQMEMHVDAYNADVTIPEAPDDAVSLEELFGGLDDGSDDSGDDPLNPDWGDIFGTS